MEKILMVFGMILILYACGTSSLNKNSENTISTHWQGYKSWFKTSGNTPITGDETRFLGGKHRGNNGYRVVYINEKGKAINQGKAPYKYPVGTVVVKEQYKDKTSYEAKDKPELNIMIKLEAGKSPDTQDWGFVAGSLGEIHTGQSSKAKFCGGCHSASRLKRGDYIFVNASTYPIK